MTRRHSNIILVGIIAAVVLGLVLARVVGEPMAEFEVLGTFFLTSLKMIVVPLVLVSVIVGISALGDVRKLGRIGTRTIAYYAATTALSVFIGMALVLVIAPGEGVSKVEDQPDAEKIKERTALKKFEEKQEGGWQAIVLSFVSNNIFEALANMKMLPIIVFALFFGGVLTTVGEQGLPVIAFCRGLNAVIMKLVELIMWMAPLGIFGLVTSKFAKSGDALSGEMERIGWYMLTVLLGLAIHAFAVLPAFCSLLARRNPVRFFKAMFPALLTAWSTASSSATLPLTVECARDRAQVSPKSAGFVLPLGATINMDGTALYEGVAVIFIAQVYGFHLGVGALLIIFITATLASIGAAGIPEAGLFTMVIVLTAVGLPLEGIGLLLVVDWFLDRFRTAVNVWGDSVGAAYIHHHVDGAGVLETPQ